MAETCRLVSTNFLYGSQSKYLSFSFIPTGIIHAGPNAVLALPKNYHFAVMQSTIHESWARLYSSTLETRLQYAVSDCVETFPFPTTPEALNSLGESYHEYRRKIMHVRQEGLTKTYNRFHNPTEDAEDITELRRLHIEMDQAVAVAYGWTDLDLGHGFHETKQGMRLTISEAARREVLDRLLLLNHQRYAEEVKAGLHDKGAKKSKGKRGTAVAEGQGELF